MSMALKIDWEKLAGNDNYNDDDIEDVIDDDDDDDSCDYEDDDTWKCIVATVFDGTKDHRNWAFWQQRSALAAGWKSQCKASTNAV
jgi:hypothetical protein